MVGSEPRGDVALRGFARKIARLERDLRILETAAQGAHRSVEEGSVDFYDEDGVLRERVGKQIDGSYGRVTVEGPVPPTPSEPDVVVIDNGVVAITWDGRCDEKWPFAEFRNVRVHLGDTATFTPTRNNQVGTIHAHRGGTIVAVTESDDDNPVYVRLVAVSTAGHTSAPSDGVLVDELDEDDLADDEELQWEDGDGHTLTTSDVTAGTVTFNLSHIPEQKSVLAWIAGAPQRFNQFTVDYDAATATFPLTGWEREGDEISLYYPYFDGPASAATLVGSTQTLSPNNNTRMTVDVPSGTQVGDLLVVFAHRYNSNTVGIGAKNGTLPDGVTWTKLGEIDGVGPATYDTRAVVWWGIAAEFLLTTNAGQFDITTPGTASLGAEVVALRNFDPANPIAGFGMAASAVAGTLMTAPDVAASGTALRFFTSHEYPQTPSGSLTPNQPTILHTSADHWSGMQDASSYESSVSGSSGTATATASASRSWAAMTVVVRPA